MPNKSKAESIESYLAQIAHELRDLPSQARAEELREIESHLRAMIEARGDVAAVLAQFGKPRRVGRDLRRAWERKQPESWINGALALVVSCGFAGWHGQFIFWLYPLHSGHSFLVAYSSIDVVWMEVFKATIFGLILGLFLGLIAPQRKWFFIFLTMILMSSFDFLPILTGDLTWLKYFFVSYTIRTLLPLTLGAYLGTLSVRKHSITNIN